MKILITGSNGFIGSHLTKHLTLNGFDIFEIVREKPVNKVVERNIIIGDLEKKEEIVENVKQTIDKVDVIIHLASSMASEDNLDDARLIIRNINISNTVAELASELHISKLIHLSSMAVYPNVDGNFDENSTVNPGINTDALYGLSKFNAEIILEYKLASKGIYIAHLRTSMVYGDGMNATRILPVLENEKKEKGTITIFGNGERMLNLIHIDKLVNIIESFVLNNWQGIYNVGDEYLSLIEIAERINSDGKASIIKIEKGNRYKFKLDCEKLKELLSV